MAASSHTWKQKCRRSRWPADICLMYWSLKHESIFQISSLLFAALVNEPCQINAKCCRPNLKKQKSKEHRCRGTHGLQKSFGKAFHLSHGYRLTRRRHTLPMETVLVAARRDDMTTIPRSISAAFDHAADDHFQQSPLEAATDGCADSRLKRRERCKNQVHRALELSLRLQ